MGNSMEFTATGSEKDELVARKQAALEQFQQRWHTYRKVVDNDYLSHRQAYATLHDYLLENYPRPFRLLDLACGDASSCAKALHDTAISEYVGVDLSGTALTLAHDKLHPLGCQVQLVQQDFADYAEHCQQHFDVIWIGLSLHHLPRKAKQRLFRELHRMLADGGSLLIYEPTLDGDESHDTFMRRTARLIHDQWQALDQDERVEIYNHIHHCDLPEALAVWEQLARNAGFAGMRQLFVDTPRMYRLYRFQP
jgi:SAM-dependent methyltransferase